MEKDAGEKTIAWLDKIRNSNGSIPTSKIRLNMQRIMQNNAAVFRTQETLEEGTFLQVVVFSFFIFIFIFLLLLFFLVHSLPEFGSLKSRLDIIHDINRVFLVGIFTGLETDTTVTPFNQPK